MKKLIAFTMAALTLGFTASAQTERSLPQTEQGSRGQHRGKGAKHDMLKDLNLSPEQKAQWKEQAKIMKAERQQLKKQDQLTVKEMREREKAMRKAHATKMDGILTPDQRAKMAEIRKNKGGKGKHGKMKKNRSRIS